nr:MAG TPA: ssRNA positive strand viral 18kD cysteine rich protein [Caudoviricetes sp.]DAT36348.1 MAG TPA: ssRNA positive strand viral 18kD cysteine rich protein [Caudoviricetes sp.]
MYTAPELNEGRRVKLQFLLLLVACGMPCGVVLNSSWLPLTVK